MYIIAGLGNPGDDYKYTRHNMGFLTIDKIAERLNIRVNKIKFKGLVGDGSYAGEKILLIKPQTYMNKSGESIRDVVNFYKIDPQNLIVLVDDIDIDFAQVKIKRKGSAGTHNGLKSVIYQLISDDFPRVKIGVGKKHQGQDLANFVLSGFSKSEKVEIEEAIEKAADATLEIIERGVESAMNKYNGK
ncbi:aminoacyl-tRNA hydrolase [Peptoniphilus catoniae]|uniref:aminoacyl-tRNA hydrolase n=1 Tax=Peptoniphilus catoniae TaxID=1660341 RepID=UPI0010FEB95F|nr:aminoacyl-tRNA hydrolase [Peptoniphilus catoniae]